MFNSVELPVPSVVFVVSAFAHEIVLVLHVPSSEHVIAILLFVSSSECVIVLVVSSCEPGSSFFSLSNSMRATSPPINSKAK